jgi:hypothetical protein
MATHTQEMMGAVMIGDIQRFQAIDPKLLVEYEREMEEAIPQIIKDIEKREVLAIEARRRILKKNKESS